MFGNRIGIVGGGQLGRMLGFAAKKMGFYVMVTDPTPNSPAGQVVDHQIVANYQDEKAIRELGENSDFLTFEIELANAEILKELSDKGLQINPSAKTLGIIKDKLEQKKFLQKAKVPTAKFMEVKSREDIIKAGAKFGYPLMLKARFDAYDGRGNAVIKTKENINQALIKLDGRRLYVEAWVKFEKELAVMVARSTSGDIKSFPVVETLHKNNICHLVFAPAQVKGKIIKNAQKLAKNVMKSLGGAGVFGIEMFLTDKGQVLINELAPRVHNSGHYTMEGCATSQFEQHIRAITGMPLGDTKLIHPAVVMINILGEREGIAQPDGLHMVHKLPGTSVHIYGKLETRTERKMGHITVVADDINTAHKLALKARKFVKI